MRLPFLHVRKRAAASAAETSPTVPRGVDLLALAAVTPETAEFLSEEELRRLEALCHKSVEEEAPTVPYTTGLAVTSTGLTVVQKATKTEDGADYPSSAFLVTPDLNLPSTWKLRIWETPALKVTKAQLGRAAAALSSGGFRGNPVQLSAGEKKSAIARLKSLYRTVGATPDEIPGHLG